MMFLYLLLTDTANMAKFDILYPNAQYLEQIDFEGSFLFKCNDLQPCWHCGDETTWCDGCFMVHLCSEECERAKWGEYAKVG